MGEMRDERGAVLEILLEIVHRWRDNQNSGISQQQGGEIQAVTAKEIEKKDRKKKQNSDQGQTVTVRET
jgi:hypothetical protein